ncbi:PD-(D/E)XK nuclease family protein, partial [Candidatus Nomurabacteria bacterium]|nr:PD-(D/E)XK nuclease family protein [Candidatus Nomurabacteria bacterium]
RALGQAVHTTLENLKDLPVEERLKRDLLSDFEESWKAVSGKIGGFKSAEEEAEYKARGRSMIERVVKNLGPIAQKTLKLKESSGGMLPNFYLSEDEGIILCGLVDWIEYIESDDSVKILDFKTGKRDEKEDSLQLPIYLLLLKALQKRKVSGAAYWYIDRSDKPVDVELPDVDKAREKLLEIGRKIKEAREKKEFKCPKGEKGCFACRPYEAIVRGEAEYVGVGNYKQDLYVISEKQ